MGRDDWDWAFCNQWVWTKRVAGGARNKRGRDATRYKWIPFYSLCSRLKSPIFSILHAEGAGSRTPRQPSGADWTHEYESVSKKRRGAVQDPIDIVVKTP